MPDFTLEINQINSDPLYRTFAEALRENPELYPDFVLVRKLNSAARITIAKWAGIVGAGFFSNEHNLSIEEIAVLLTDNNGLLEDYKQFQTDGETVRNIRAKHQDAVDMQFWASENAPVVYEAAAFLGLGG